MLLLVLDLFPFPPQPPSVPCFHLEKSGEVWTHDDDVIIRNLHIAPLLFQLHLRRPIRARLVAMLVAVGHFF